MHNWFVELMELINRRTLVLCKDRNLFLGTGRKERNFGITLILLEFVWDWFSFGLLWIFLYFTWDDSGDLLTLHKKRLFWNMYLMKDEEEVTNYSRISIREGVNDGRLRFRSSDSLLPGLIDDVALNCLAWACRSDYASLAGINKRFHRLIKNGCLYELRKQLGIVEHWVYLVCDPRRGWEAFDPIRKKWMGLPIIPCDECFNHADKESLAVGSELLVFGRELSDFAIWKYSLIRHAWIKCEGMNRPRCLFASSSYGSVAIVAGGTDRNGNVLNSAELYDSTTGRWEVLPNMHSQRRMCSGFFMDGKFYVIGGMSSPTVSLTCGEEYDLETRKWRTIEGMYPNVNRATEAPPLVAVVDNELYAVEYLTNMVKKYDKVKNTWHVLGRLPVRTDSSNGWGLAFKACGDQLLVVGGQRGPDEEGIVLNSWCPKTPIKNGTLDWKVLGVKEHVGVFVYNCAVMGC